MSVITESAAEARDRLIAENQTLWRENAQLRLALHACAMELETVWASLGQHNPNRHAVAAHAILIRMAA